MFCKVKRSIKEYREWQMKIYTRVEDSLEQRLAGVIAAKQKLAEQKWNNQFDALLTQIEDRIQKDDELEEIRIIIQNLKIIKKCSFGIIAMLDVNKVERLFGGLKNF